MFVPKTRQNAEFSQQIFTGVLPPDPCSSVPFQLMLSDRLAPSIFDAWPASAAVVICYSLPGPGCCLVGHRDMRGFKSSLVVLPAVAAPRKTTATRAGLKGRLP